MPKSRSKRSRYQPPPRPKPKPSPRWVGVGFFTLLGVGLVCIVARYMWAGSPFDRNSVVYISMALIAAAFVLSTRWH